MTPLDRLRQHAGIPDAYSWAAVALSLADARAIVALVEQAEQTIADLRAQLADATPRRCSDCGRGARELIATQDTDGSVVYLGPGCSKKRTLAAHRRAEALPLGGER